MSSSSCMAGCIQIMDSIHLGRYRLWSDSSMVSRGTIAIQEPSRLSMVTGRQSDCVSGAIRYDSIRVVASAGHSRPTVSRRVRSGRFGRMLCTRNQNTGKRLLSDKYCVLKKSSTIGVYPITPLIMRYLLLISALITIGLTTLVSMPGSPYLIGGMTQADISAMFATSVTPAGFTFGIWSLIYLSWIIAWAYVAFFKKWNAKIDTKSLVLFSLAILLTVVWLIPWGYLYISVSLIVMLAILGLLAYVFTRTRTAHIVVRSSIEITLGWIIMATALNVTVWMIYMGWSIGGPADLYYALWVLAVIVLIVAVLQCRYRTYIISAVFLWTLLGIWVAHPVVEQQWAVTLCAVITILNIVYSYRKK